MGVAVKYARTNTLNGCFIVPVKQVQPEEPVSPADNQACVLEGCGRRVAVVCEWFDQCQSARRQECPHLGCQWLQGLPGEKGPQPPGRRWVGSWEVEGVA